MFEKNQFRIFCLIVKSKDYYTQNCLTLSDLICRIKGNKKKSVRF